MRAIAYLKDEHSTFRTAHTCVRVSLCTSVCCCTQHSTEQFW